STPTKPPEALVRAAFLSLATLLAGALFAEQAPHATADTAHAQAAHSAEGVEFKAGELIMGRIADEHGWHIAGDLSLPLPVIIYDTRSGLHVFSSARFEHGHAAYEGYKLREGAIVAVDAQGQIDEAGTKAVWDISLTKNV